MMILNQFWMVVICFAMSIAVLGKISCENPQFEPDSLIIKGPCPKRTEIHCERKNALHSRLAYGNFIVQLYFPEITRTSRDNPDIANIQLTRKEGSRILAKFHSSVFSFLDFEGYYATDLDEDGIPEIVFGGVSRGSVGSAATFTYMFVISLDEKNPSICEISSDDVSDGYNFRDIDGDGCYEFICIRSDQSIDQYGEYERVYYRVFKYKKGKFLMDTKNFASPCLYERRGDSENWKCVKKLSKSQRQWYERFTTPTVSW